MTHKLPPLKSKPRRDLQWDPSPQPAKAPRSRLFHFSTLLLQRTALLLALTVLTTCYALTPGDNVTAVLARKKVLPVYSVERTDQTIAVTFDASWGADNTPKLLDLLDEYDAKCTFFLVGLWVDKYPEMVKEIVARGHEIGNHSATHPHMSQLTEEKMREELRRMSDQVEQLTGTRPTLFRPPYGDYDDRVVTVSRAEGYECVQWSVDSLDWKNISAQDMIRRSEKVQQGDIILFHNDSQYLLEALPAILQGYKAQGLRMVKASELLLQGETTIDVTGKQHPTAARDTTGER